MENTGVWYKSVESNTGSPIFEQGLGYENAIFQSTFVNAMTLDIGFVLHIYA